jgi:hypothetical protein
MTMLLTNRRVFTFALAAFTGISLLTPPVMAQSIPPNLNPGAVLNWDQRNLMMQRQFPFLWRPMTDEDVTGPKPDPDAIVIEDGVLPEDKSIQGMLQTPNGVYLTGPERP